MVAAALLVQALLVAEFNPGLLLGPISFAVRTPATHYRVEGEASGGCVFAIV